MRWLTNVKVNGGIEGEHGRGHNVHGSRLSLVMWTK
jgi:hypothetical protein